MMHRLLLLFLSLGGLRASSQLQNNYALSTVQEKLQLLQQNKKMLFIGLLPGSENTRLLTVLRKKYHFQTAFLMLTRGEAMNNYCGQEKGVDLGIIHAQEIAAAARIGGFSVFATSCVDMGARDTSTLAQVLNRQRLLADIASVIRQYRPDIIVAGGQAAADPPAYSKWLGELCLEANRLAGNNAGADLLDATVTLQGASYSAPWIITQVLKSSPKTATAPAINGDQKTIAIPMEGFDPVSGMQYCAIALRSKQEERSLFVNLDSIAQFSDTVSSDTTRYKLLAGANVPVLIADADYGAWSRLKAGDSLRQGLALLLNQLQHEGVAVPENSDNPISASGVKNPALSLLPGLRSLYRKLLTSEGTGPDKLSSLEGLKSLYLACAGLAVQASADRDLGVLGQDFNLHIKLQNPVLPVAVKRIQVGKLMDTVFASRNNIGLQLRAGQGISLDQQLHLPLQQPAYQPFWLNKPFRQDGSYQVDQAMQGRLTDTSCYHVELSLMVDSFELALSVPVVFRQFDRFKGPVTHPFYTVEPVILTLSPDVLLTNITGDTRPYKKPKLKLKIKTLYHDSSTLAMFKIRQVGIEAVVNEQQVRSGEASLLYRDASFISPEPGRTLHVDLFFDSVLAKKWHPGTPILKPEAILRMKEGAAPFSSNIKTVGYDYQPGNLYNYHSQTIIVADSVQTKGSRVAYIGGQSQDVWENALHQLGFRLTESSPADLLKISLPVNANDSTLPTYVADSLRHFDAIVVNLRPNDQVADSGTLKRLQLLFKTYVQEGGVLLNLSPDAPERIGLPMMDTTRVKLVINDTNYVKIRVAQQALLQYPNKIEPSHFIHWYGLMALGDVGFDSSGLYPLKVQPLKNGHALYPVSLRKIGKGVFINCFLDLPSRLSSGSPFAYKFLANLIAAAHQKTPKQNEISQSSQKAIKKTVD